MKAARAAACFVTPLPPSLTLATDHHDHRSKRSSFLNPWPSYRAASLSDAWLAFQRGAAIAPARKKSAAPSEVQFAESEDGNTDEEEPLIQSTRPKTNKSRKYVRPEFSIWHEDDHEDDWRDPPVAVVAPRWDDRGVGNEGGIEGKASVTWLGHAGVMVRIPWKENEKGKGKEREGMCGVLFDPIFSYSTSDRLDTSIPRARWKSYQRYTSAVYHTIIANDHLDYYTIMDLWKHHESTIHFFVPLGLKAWFSASGIPAIRVTELDWYHEALLSFPSSPSAIPAPLSPPETSLHYPPYETPGPSVDPSASLTLKIAFTPGQHRSGRGIFDHMTTLWGSWCVGVVEERDSGKAVEPSMKGWAGFKVFFGGDTGYRYATAPEGDLDAICPVFETIASLYSPFSLSLLPLSTGSSLPFLRNLLSLSLDQYTLTSSLHCSPADSLEIHRILSAERSLGVHWGTFCDSDEARGTRVEFGRRRRDVGVKGTWEGEGEIGQEGEGKGRFVICDIGESLVIP